MAAEQKENANAVHLSLVICGHVDAGKSTTTGRLIFELGGINEREMEKLRAEAKALNKESFAFAFYMDRQKEERARGVTIACTTKEFYTAKYHYTIIDAPGHRDFIKNMITGASQADVAVLMVPADGNFTTSIMKGNHKAGQVPGQTRQHAQLINLLGVTQLIIGVNKMDCDVAGYKESRYKEIKDEVFDCLLKVGWKKEFVTASVPMIPISGWIGDNLLKKSDKMGWWKGMKVKTVSGKEVNVETLLDALNEMVEAPVRSDKGQPRMPVSGVYKIKGVGDVITGRVEQGLVKPGDEVKFLPTHTAANPCKGKVFTVEMHHRNCPQAGPGDNVGMNIKGLDKGNMPQAGDVMVLEKDNSIAACDTFTVQVQVLSPPNELKVGYCPIVYVRTAHVSAKMTAINWRLGKDTGKKKAEAPVHIKANDVAELVMQPQQPFVCDAFKNCAGLGRVAIMEGNSVVMLGKITVCNFKAEAAKK